MERSWGYASQVGRWCGTVDVPTELVGQSLAATEFVLREFIPLLRQIHRPTMAGLTWVEYDKEGQEVASHELEEVAVADWDAIGRHFQELATRTSSRVELHALFIDLDTCVIDPSGHCWAEKSATFQVSTTPPGLGPFSVGVCYTTYIDVWLSTTYGQHYETRSNKDAADRNRPHLEGFLRRFAELVGASFTTDRSQLYYFAITSTGFRDVDDLPSRGIP